MWRLYLCILEVESSDNVLLSPSSLDLLRLRKSTWVIGISIWFDVDSILRRCVEVKRRKGLNVAGRCLNIWCLLMHRNYWFFHFWISGMDQTLLSSWNRSRSRWQGLLPVGWPSPWCYLIDFSSNFGSNFTHIFQTYLMLSGSVCIQGPIRNGSFRIVSTVDCRSKCKRVIMYGSL